MTGQQEEKPVFGAHNPALDAPLEPGGGDVLKWIIASVLVVLVAYWLLGMVASILARRIPDATEAELFGWASTILSDQPQEVTRESPEQVRARSILTEMSRHSWLRRLPYTLVYSKNPEPNAFAVPGGTVAVTQGLLDLVKGDMGLAMVIGHELGHHQNRDPLRAMGRSLLLSSVTTIFTGGNPGLARYVIEFAESSYSRKQEHMADEFGLRLVFSTYYTTAGALEFFEKIDLNRSALDGKLTRMMSSHPYTPDRLEALRKIASSLSQ